MAYTATQLQALIDLRATGRLQVTDADGKSLRFQTGADLDAAIAAAKRDVAAATASASGNRLYQRRYMEHSRG